MIYSQDYIGSTALNTFIKDPAKFFIEYCIGVRGEYNVFAARGHAIELGLNEVFEGRPETATKIAMQHYLNASMSLEDELDGWFDIIDNSINVAKNNLVPNCKILSTQRCEVKEYKGLKFRALIDYHVEMNGESHCIDLKTVKKLPKIVTQGKRAGLIEKIKETNILQQVFYRWVLGTDEHFALFYTDGKDSLLYRITDRDIQEHEETMLQNIDRICKMMECSYEEVANYVYPDMKKFRYNFWTYHQVEKGLEIWGEKFYNDLLGIGYEF